MPTPAEAAEAVLDRTAAIMAVVRAAQDSEHAHGWPLACPHVRDSGFVLCGRHPGAGFLCPACMREHAVRSAELVDRLCDLCGQAPVEQLGSSEVVLGRAFVRKLDGESLVIGPGYPLRVVGQVSLCEGCDAARGAELFGRGQFESNAG